MWLKTQLSRGKGGLEPRQSSSRGSEHNSHIKLYRLYKLNCIALPFWCPLGLSRVPGPSGTLCVDISVHHKKPPVCVLTGGWGCVQVHIFTVLAVASLVAATDTQHVHGARVGVLKKGTGAPHLLPALPARGARLGGDICAPELNSVMPGRWRVRGQPPAQEDLIIGKGALGVDDRRLGHCWKRQRGQSGPGTESRRAKEEAAGAGG